MSRFNTFPFSGIKDVEQMTKLLRSASLWSCMPGIILLLTLSCGTSSLDKAGTDGRNPQAKRERPDSVSLSSLYNLAARNDLVGLNAALSTEQGMALMSHFRKGVTKGPVLGLTPLHLAAQHGNAEMVKVLLAAGFDVDVVETKDSPESGWTPLAVAASNGNLEIVKLLVDHGADPQVGQNPLECAVIKENVEVVEFLAAKLPAGKRTHAVSLAASRGYLAIVRALVESGASVDYFTAVGIAHKQGHSDTVAYLLKHAHPSERYALIKVLGINKKN